MFALGQFELNICLTAAAIRAILSSADRKKLEERFFFSKVAFTPKVRLQSWDVFRTTL